MTGSRVPLRSLERLTNAWAAPRVTRKSGSPELALTFAGSTAVKDIALVGEALKHA